MRSKRLPYSLIISIALFLSILPSSVISAPSTVEFRAEATVPAESSVSAHIAESSVSAHIAESSVSAHIAESSVSAHIAESSVSARIMEANTQSEISHVSQVTSLAASQSETAVAADKTKPAQSAVSQIITDVRQPYAPANSAVSENASTAARSVSASQKPAEETVSAQKPVAFDIDGSMSSHGLVKAMCSETVGKKIKVIISRNNVSYIYNLRTDGTYQSFPLQLGNGRYKVSMMKNVRDNLYTTVSKKEIVADVADADAYSIYLNSIQNIDWQNSDSVVEKAAQLVEGVLSDEGKIKVIYDYIVNNIKFDYDKVNTLYPGYLPDAEKMLAVGSGICYDFSSLLASMLRSVGIPAKLMMGTSVNASGYHAWNEVYIESLGKWAVIDASCDSQLLSRKKAFLMYKPENEYVADKMY